MSLSGDAGWLALRALVAAPGRSLALSAALGIAFGMPALTLSAAARAQQALQHRARETPVVIGAPGDTFDLAFAAMHFRPGGTRPLPWATLEQLAAPGVLLAPMHVVHTADGAPVVGTAPEYFEARSLVAERGRLPAVVGEAVAGARAARVRGLQVGHTLRSDLEALHDLSGEAPLTLTITGILEHTGTSDDNALFTDVRTAWALDGRLHGHGSLRADETLPGTTRAHAYGSGAVLPADTRPDALGAFHLHGGLAEQPLTAIVAFPKAPRDRDLLLDRIASADGIRAVRPDRVVSELLAIGHRVRDGLLVFLGLVGTATLALVALCLDLSRRLRAEETALLRRLGAHPMLVPRMHAIESATLIGLGLAFAALMTAAADTALAQAMTP